MSPASQSPSRVDSPADQAVWDELDRVLDQVATAAKASGPPEEFYRTTIAHLATLLAPTHAVVWLRKQGRLQLAAQSAGWAESVNDRPKHEHLVATAMQSDKVVSLPPRGPHASTENPTNEHYLIAPVTLEDWTHDGRGALAAIALLLPAGRAPSSYQGAEQVLAAASDLAAGYHIRQELARLSQERSTNADLARFAEQIDGENDLVRTAMAITNEGRRLLDCDRLSVLASSGRGAKLLASSGTQRIERRSRAARALEQLAAMAVQLDEPIEYADQSDGDASAAPQVEQAVTRYVDEFHARRLVVMPVPSAKNTFQNSKTRGVLVAEQFGVQQRDLSPMAVAELASTAAPAVANAVAWHELPLGSVLRTLGWLRMPRTLFRLSVAALFVGAIAMALLTVPTTLTVDVRGQLVPVERRDVFAPRTAIVDRLAVEHGRLVNKDETLLVLRDPELAAQIEQLRGEQATTRKQLEAVRSTRTTAAAASTDPLELYRLSGEEQQLKTKLENLDQQLSLRESEARSLEVVSPLAGSVTTWQVDERLAPGRPVERGQVLVTVADTAGDWLVELAVPDEKLDLLRDANDEPLVVEYRLGSDASELHTATVSRIAQRADLVTTPAGSEHREVRVEALPDQPLPDELRTAALRPGGSVRARIIVGEKPMGYVMMHDFWRTLRNWWEF